MKLCLAFFVCLLIANSVFGQQEIVDSLKNLELLLDNISAKSTQIFSWGPSDQTSSSIADILTSTKEAYLQIEALPDAPGNYLDDSGRVKVLKDVTDASIEACTELSKTVTERFNMIDNNPQNRETLNELLGTVDNMVSSVVDNFQRTLIRWSTGLVNSLRPVLWLRRTDLFSAMEKFINAACVIKNDITGKANADSIEKATEVLESIRTAANQVTDSCLDSITGLVQCLPLIIKASQINTEANC